MIVSYKNGCMIIVNAEKIFLPFKWILVSNGKAADNVLPFTLYDGGLYQKISMLQCPLWFLMLLD